MRLTLRTSFASVGKHVDLRFTEGSISSFTIHKVERNLDGAGTITWNRVLENWIYSDTRSIYMTLCSSRNSICSGGAIT